MSSGVIDAPPALTEADLIARLEETIQATQRGARLVAIHGSWTGPETVKSEDLGVFEVRAALSEMHLRSIVPPPDEARSVVFVVPWTQRLPLDLAARFARGGKVQAVGTKERLQRMFRVRDASEALRRSPKLARHLLRRADRTFPTPGTQLRPQALWDTWLRKIVGAASHESAAPLAALFAWALGASGGAEHGAEIDESPGLRAELESALDERYGAGAVAVWRAWERGESEDLLVACVWMEILREQAHAGVEQSFWIRHIERRWGLAPESPGAVALSRCLDAVVSEDPALARALERACRKAEHVIVDEERAPDLIDALKRSPRLEPGLDGCRERLGVALIAFAQRPAPERWESVRASFESLRDHRMAAERGSLIAQAEMAVRLAGFLLERSDLRIPIDDSPRAELKRLARWYVSEGGYVDWARTRARHAPGAGELGKGVRAVLAQVDAIRREMDRAFATGLADWYADGRRGEPLLPIEAATKRFVADFLAESDERRVLIVLLDGMGWAQAVELLADLERKSDEAAWGVVAWSGALAAKHGGDFIPVQAALPTITEVSRASFFAGKAFGTKDSRDTSADEKRFAANTALRKVSDTEPKLFLQASLNAAGSITDVIRRKIDDRGERVVGIVLNAIDDWLSAGIGQAPAWNVGSIHALPSLLEAARKARRVVLFASDHGHVPGAQLEHEKAATSGGARWRALHVGARGEGTVLADHEVAFRKDRAWAPPGAEGVVLLADEHHRYSTQRRAGEHGGATLAEVLCPTFLLGYRGLRDDLGDDQLDVLEPRIPAWWLLAPATQPVLRPTAQQPLETRSTSIAKAHEDPVWPSAEPPKSAPPARPAKRESHPLLSSPLFTGVAKDEKHREQVLVAVDFLAGRNGRANGKAFAGAMRKRHATLNGFIAHLQKVLNEDQALVLRYDAATDQVILDVPLLEAVFEVKL